MSDLRERVATYLVRDMRNRPNTPETDPMNWAYVETDAILALTGHTEAGEWECTHCGKRWDGPEVPGERRHWVDATSELDESYLCGPVERRKGAGR